MTASSPISARERIELLDVLRGFALLGIMFGNMTWFTGYAVLSDEQRVALGTQGIDQVIAWLIHVLVDEKFWSLFALLFGVGVAMQAQRARDPQEFSQLYVRRILAMLSIGLAHAIFLWFGDIISLYAVVGLVLLLFRRSTDKTVLIWSIRLLLLPIAVLTLWLCLHNLRTPGNTVDPGHGPIELLKFFAGGTYWEAFSANWAFLKERWAIAVYDGRLFKLAGMFLLGWWAGRQDLFIHIDRHRRQWWLALEAGLLLGIPINIGIYTFFPGVGLRPPSEAGLVMQSLKAVGTPLLCMGYVSAIVLAYPLIAKRLPARLLAAPGRMSLTNYLLQSVVGIIVFYGCGFGMWGKVGTAWSVVIILAIFASQIVLSQLWLYYFRQGPVEWLWRCLTYWRPLPLRRRSVEQTYRAPEIRVESDEKVI